MKTQLLVWTSVWFLLFWSHLALWGLVSGLGMWEWVALRGNADLGESQSSSTTLTPFPFILKGISEYKSTNKTQELGVCLPHYNDLSKSQRVCFPIALLSTVWIFVCVLLLFCPEVFFLLFHCHELFQMRLSKIQCLCPSVTLHGWAVLKVLVALQTLLTIVLVWKCSPALFGTQLTELWDNSGNLFSLFLMVMLSGDWNVC